jgi:hypothetical protein
VPYLATRTFGWWLAGRALLALGPRWSTALPEHINDHEVHEAYVTHNDRPEPAGFSDPPILRHKHYDAPSVFTPASLLREARRPSAVAQTRSCNRREDERAAAGGIYAETTTPLMACTVIILQ